MLKYVNLYFIIVTVRLVDGNNYEGRVEAFLIGKWRSIFISDNTWGLLEASTVCTSLGFDSAREATRYPHQSFDSHPFKFESIECPDDAPSLNYCPYTWHHGPETLQAAGVVCIQGKQFTCSFMQPLLELIGVLLQKGP